MASKDKGGRTGKNKPEAKGGTPKRAATGGAAGKAAKTTGGTKK